MALHELVRRLVRPVQQSSMEEREYSFWHLLVRDVAYSQIPRSERVRRHQVAAAWIERKGGERVEDFAEVLAHHYLQALELAAALEEHAQRAMWRCSWSGRAGAPSRRPASDQAVGERAGGRVLLPRDRPRGPAPEGDERRRTGRRLQLQLGVALFALRGLGAPEVEQAYTRATELMMASAPAAEQFLAQFGLSIYHGHRGHFHRSLRLVERLTELAAEGDDSMRLQALHARWMNSLFAGRINDHRRGERGTGDLPSAGAPSTLLPLRQPRSGVCALALQALAFAFRANR